LAVGAANLSGAVVPSIPKLVAFVSLCPWLIGYCRCRR
jgi:hypothetical protein